MVIGGQAAAANYVVNLTSTPTATIVWNQTAYFGEAFFPTVTLFVGDTLTVNVDLGETLNMPRLDRAASSASFNVGYGATRDNAAVMFVTPVDFGNLGTTFSGFSWSGSAILQTHGVSVPDGFSLNKISYHMQALPEPSTWTIMVLGFGSLGAMLRRRRASTPGRVGATA
jgi:hypothetical protein